MAYRTHISNFIAALFLFSCQEIDKPNPLLPSFAGTDLLDVEEFMVRLDADSLKSNEFGTWSIFSGLVDEKVSFDHENSPKTLFHGLPGETYKLLWSLRTGGKTRVDTVLVSFVPLTTEIISSAADFYQTRIELHAKMYDKGEWTVEGDYQEIKHLSFGGGIYVPPQNTPDIKFFGLEDKKAKITWTTWYGSKSASATLEYTAGKYHQYEAMEDLQLLNSPYYYRMDESGNITHILLSGDGRGRWFEDMEQFPALQGLTQLTRLELSGVGLESFPEVITAKYHQLKTLIITHARFTSLPENFGNLTEMDTLMLSTIQSVSSLPESFGNLSKLRFLHMVDLGLTSLPESFSQLTSLNYLNLNVNTIEKLPEQIGNLKNLESFHGPTLRQSVPSSFAGLTNLKLCHFTVTGNSVVLPPDIGNLTKLETLQLQGDYKALPESFSNLTSLKVLEIVNSSGLSSIPQNFGNLTKLKNINIVVDLDRLPSSFSLLPNLQHMTLHGRLWHLPSDIGKLASVEGLGLNDLDLKDLPESIGDLKNLKMLRLSHNDLVTLPAGIGNLPKIETIDVGRNEITHFPSSMGKLANTLRYLYINGNRYPEAELNSLRLKLPHTEITTWLEGD